MAYADLNQLKADYLPDVKSEAEVAALGRILDNVSAFVDTYCRRVSGFFNASPALPSGRRVRGEGERFLRVPIHVTGSVSVVTYHGQTVDPATYYESEKNGWLYFEDQSVSDSWNADTNYIVTARWGYAATPPDLVEAVRQTVVRIWETQHGVLGDVSPSGFVIERTMPVFAREVLDQYKRREFEV